MKSFRLLLHELLPIFVILFVISTVTAQGPNGPDHPMGGGHNMPRDDGHMSGYTQNIEIHGEISVEDSIQLAIKIQPTKEAEERMIGGRHRMEPDDFMNEIRVRFMKMVEFIDISQNGYTSDDLIISSYNLNISTLDQPELLSDETYQILSSVNNIFEMNIDLKYESNLFFGYKWSLILNYPFSNQNTSLALIHDIETSQGSLSNAYRNSRAIEMNSDCVVNGTEIMDSDVNLPMIFTWANDVEVDGETKNTTTTLVNEYTIISLPKGNTIHYDPSIEGDLQSLFQIESKISSIQLLADYINSPTILGLISASIIILIMMVYSVKKRNIEV